MWWISPYTKHILSKYRTHLESADTIPTGFTGVAFERPAPKLTNEVDYDILYFAAYVNFNSADATVNIKALSPPYQWMTRHPANIFPTDTPINAVAGVFSQLTPILSLMAPFFLKKHGRLWHQFENSAAAPITGGLWTWRTLKLADPIDGIGWDYAMGFSI